jgi:hypothetical protein
MPRRVSFAKTPSPTRATATAESSSSSEDEEVKTSSELTILYSGEAPLLDLVAVENLSENGQSWGSQGDTCWLRHEDFLPKEIPKARVFSFGYTLGNDFNILALGTALLKALEAARSEVEVSFVQVEQYLIY